MGHISDEIRRLHGELHPSGVELVAVSKFHSADKLREAYDAGQRIFGESRVNELLEKQPLLPSDISWHFIGHLQTNKVGKLVGRVDMIESVDSLRLLDAIDAAAEARGITVNVLMQVHVAAETTKFGFLPDELLDYFTSKSFEKLKAVHICGLMAMATNTDDSRRIESDFASVAALRRRILEAAPELRGFDILSMGMSDDYHTAIACGSTHVRIGTDIFGPRDY